MLADYAIAKTGGHVHALVVNLPVCTILTAFSKGYAAELKAKCPTCKSQELDQQVSDFAGAKIPGNIVSVLQKDPSINWVALPLGDMTTGLSAELRSAGLTDKVSVAAESAGSANIGELKRGDKAVFAGFPATILGWHRMDVAARYFTGSDLAPNEKAFLPTQLLTTDNVKNAQVDSTGYYVGVSDYAAQFKKMWMEN
jgi:ribose transport system substrate-binding protein